MKKLKNKKGLTLLEVIISIAILGIIATAFLSLFGNNFASMASFGKKSEAVMGAADIIEKVYSNADSYTEDSLEEELNDDGTKDDQLKGKRKTDNEESLNDSLTEGTNFNYYFEATDISVSGQLISGYNLTIAYPKGNSGEMEKITTFILGQEDSDGKSSE